MKKFFLTFVLATAFISIAAAQQRTVVIKCELKGLDAEQVVLVHSDSESRRPIDVATTVADKGKCEFTIQADPSLRERYAIYLPNLDTPDRSNDKSREYFFLDTEEIRIVAKVKNDGFTEFSVPSSTTLKQYKEANTKIDFGPYNTQKIAESRAHQLMSDFQMSKDPARTGIEWTDADSLEFKRLKEVWKQEAGKFFASESQLGEQALKQVTAEDNKGLNILLFDHYRSGSETAINPLIKSLLKVKSVENLKSDYYLNYLYEKYIQFNAKGKDAEVADFDFITIDSKVVRLGDLKGKYVYVNVWDVQDPDFEANMTAMEALCAKYAARKDLVFVNLNLNQDQDVWKAVMDGRTDLKALQWGINDNQRFYKTYDIYEFPRAIMINKEQRIMQYKMGGPENPVTVEYLDTMLD